MNLVPKYRKEIMKFFKKTLGYGYRCTICDRNARICEAFTLDDGFDYVTFRCPGCKGCWSMEFKNKEIGKLVA